MLEQKFRCGDIVRHIKTGGMFTVRVVVDDDLYIADAFGYQGEVRWTHSGRCALAFRPERTDYVEAVIESNGSRQTRLYLTRDDMLAHYDTSYSTTHIFSAVHFSHTGETTTIIDETIAWSPAPMIRDAQMFSAARGEHIVLVEGYVAKNLGVKVDGDDDYPDGQILIPIDHCKLTDRDLSLLRVAGGFFINRGVIE